MNSWHNIQQQVIQGSFRAVARAISLIENEVEGYGGFLEQLAIQPAKVIGLTGPPGAGKSTLADALIGHLVEADNRVAVLCVDPSSPFNMGALLGDRIRMSSWYNHPSVFIRSLATRGSLGGLHPKIIEIVDVLKAAGFDYVIVETVGVGQTEVEIAGLADTTVVVLVPEAGDDIQAMKAGLMEIADLFVVNKADRPGADAFIRNLRMMLGPAFNTIRHDVPVIRAISTQNEGIRELLDHITTHQQQLRSPDKKHWLLTRKAWQLIQHARMKDISMTHLQNSISEHAGQPQFNLYRFVKEFV